MPPKKRLDKAVLDNDDDGQSPQNKRARKEPGTSKGSTLKKLSVNVEDLDPGGNGSDKIVPHSGLQGFLLPWYKKGKKKGRGSSGGSDEDNYSDDDEEEEYDEDEDEDDMFDDEDDDMDDDFDDDEEDIYNFERRRRPAALPGRAFGFPDFAGYKAGAAGTTSTIQRMLGYPVGPQASAALAGAMRLQNPVADQEESDAEEEDGEKDTPYGKNSKAIETAFRVSSKNAKNKSKPFAVSQDAKMDSALPARMEWKVQKKLCESSGKVLSEIEGTLFVHDLSKSKKNHQTVAVGTISAFYIHTKELGQKRRTIADLLDEHSQESYEVGEFIEELYRFAATGGQKKNIVNDVGDVPTILSGDTLYIKEVIISDSSYEGHGLGLLMLDQMKKFAANEFASSSGSPQAGVSSLLTLLCVNIMWNDDDGLVGSIAARKQADKDLAIDDDSQTAAWRASVEGKPAPEKKKLTKKDEQALTSVYDTRRKAFLNYYNLLGMRFLGKKTGPYLASYGGNPDPTIEEVCPHLTGSS